MSNSPAMLVTPVQNLFQRNTDLLMHFWTSPGVVNEMRASGENMVREAQSSGLKVFQSGAFIALWRDLFASYSQFWSESMRAQVDGMAEVQERTLEQAKAGSTALRRAA